MDRRTPTETVARNVRSAVAASGVAINSVAQAADMPLSVMESRLNACTPFTFAELVRVGGFLCVPADSLLEGATA